MISSVTSATYASSLTQSSEISTAKSSQTAATSSSTTSSATSTVVQDSVSISDWAQSILEESQKTYAQIKLDARMGSKVAQALLAKLEAEGKIESDSNA